MCFLGTSCPDLGAPTKRFSVSNLKINCFSFENSEEHCQQEFSGILGKYVKISNILILRKDKQGPSASEFSS